MKLIYITLGIESVLDSQVFGLLNYYAKYKPEIESIILLVAIRTKKDMAILERKDIHKKISIKFYYNFSTFPVLQYFTKKSLYKRIKKSQITDSTIIHCRREVMGYFTFQFLTKHKMSLTKLFIDIRGAPIDEIQDFLDLAPLLKKSKIRLAEKTLKILNSEMVISAVTNSLKDYVIKKSQKQNLNIHIIPGLAGEKFKFCKQSRLEMRKELNLASNDIVFVFSAGSTRKWQNIDIIMDEITKMGFPIINLSNTIIHYKNVINRFCEYHEVYKYLSAADIAIIWREPSVASQCALPIKFCEYFCCGLPVISNDSVDSITALINKHRFGQIIKHFDEINNDLLDSLLSLDRDNISSTGRQYFGIETIAEKYLKIYKAITSTS